MALIRGTNSNFPCPVCLVPNEKLHDGIVYDCRTSESMEEVYKTAEAMSVEQAVVYSTSTTWVLYSYL